MHVRRAIGLAILLVACSTGNVEPNPTQSALESPATASPVSSDRPQPSASQAAAPETASPLVVGGFAGVVADGVVVRSLPDRDSEPVRVFCVDLPAPCPVLTVGKGGPYSSVYLIDGPAFADGFEWYLAAIEWQGNGHWDYVGWIAAGDGVDAWLVHAARQCPEPPYELSEVAFPPLPPLTALHCLGGEHLTLRGFYPEPPPQEPGPQVCASEPAWLVCNFGNHLLRVEEAPYYGSTPDIELQIHPDVGELPSRPGWIEVTGQFDHPDATLCADGQWVTILGCRVKFVLTSVRAISEP